jgi:hypothetical protein
MGTRRCKCCMGETPARRYPWRCQICGSRQFWADDADEDQRVAEHCRKAQEHLAEAAEAIAAGRLAS